jgi:hypothetical protein
MNIKYFLNLENGTGERFIIFLSLFNRYYIIPPIFKDSYAMSVTF